MVQSRISPGFTAVDLSSGISRESRSTAPVNCTLTSGRAALASMKCLCAKPAAPATINVSTAISSALNLSLDFNILVRLLSDVVLGSNSSEGLRPVRQIVDSGTSAKAGGWWEYNQPPALLQSLCRGQL